MTPDMMTDNLARAQDTIARLTAQLAAANARAEHSENLLCRLFNASPVFNRDSLYQDMKEEILALRDKTACVTKTAETADGNYGAAWIESFYNSNVGIPIYIKVINSKLSSDAAAGSYPDDLGFQSSLNGTKTYSVYMTNFSKSITKRTSVSDYVDISIEFTEI